ncbi:MAG: lipoate--protein ligase family protein [Burkholderiaceae bacterium]
MSATEYASVQRLPAAFRLHQPGPDACNDARSDESLLDLVMEHGPVASIWQAPQSLVVPRTYRRFDAFDDACQQFADRGWPVTVRQTGGGIVPQGPGIINVSLAYRVEGQPMQHSEHGYQLICGLLADALQALEVDAFPAAVEGSFCDGRYNLAAHQHGKVVKIAGTAQMWRRLRGTEHSHAGLIHALVLLDVDTHAVTDVANGFEAAIGSGRRYRADRVASIANLLASQHSLETAFDGALRRVLEGLPPL